MTTAQGSTAIEQLRTGDVVVAITAEGQQKEVAINAVIRRSSRLLTLVTDGGTLITTNEHPLWMGGDVFRAAGQLKPGEQVMMWIADAVIAVTVIMLQHGQQEVEVFNMEVDEPHVYVADGFIVHNKLVLQTPSGQ